LVIQDKPFYGTMKQIGLISDTHGYIHPRLFAFFDKVDEIWHAGDIGNRNTLEALIRFKPLKAVYGNIDGQDIRAFYPLHNRFVCEELDVWMTHIGGYPGKYDSRVKPEIFRNPPKLFISGHSHILKVVFDQKLNLLHMNPGSAGLEGMHKTCTALRFKVEGTEISKLEIWEHPRRKE
jgi:uncharacterized protein